MEYPGDDGQDKMIRAADKFLELVEKKVLSTNREEDGCYELTESDKSLKGSRV